MTYNAANMMFVYFFNIKGCIGPDGKPKEVLPH